MSIKNYGLFWRRDEVTWNPGKGKKATFRVLGRRGKNATTLRLADFRFQYGIYILYGNHGSYYVGQTQSEKHALGARLLEHCKDHHQDEWDRFSWFGFRGVLLKKDDYGLRKLGKMAQAVFNKQDLAITDVEALLIRAMNLQNINHTNFSKAEEWEQVKLHEVDKYMDRI